MDVIMACTSIASVLIALLTFLFGTNISHPDPEPPQNPSINKDEGLIQPRSNPSINKKDVQSTKPSYSIIDDSILSKFTKEDLDRYYPWVYVGRVARRTAPTDTLGQRYEFVGIRHEDDFRPPIQIWNHYVRQLINE